MLRMLFRLCNQHASWCFILFFDNKLHQKNAVWNAYKANEDNAFNTRNVEQNEVRYA